MSSDEQRHRQGLWFAAYTGQMTLLWQQVTYIQLTAAGSVAAWYIAWKDKFWALSCLALLIGAAVQIALVFLVRRHAQILDEFTKNLEEAHLINQRKEFAAFLKLSSHAIARCISVIFAIGELLLIFGTAYWHADTVVGFSLKWLSAILLALFAAACAFSPQRVAYFILHTRKRGPTLPRT